MAVRETNDIKLITTMLIIHIITFIVTQIDHIYSFKIQEIVKTATTTEVFQQLRTFGEGPWEHVLQLPVLSDYTEQRASKQTSNITCQLTERKTIEWQSNRRPWKSARVKTAMECSQAEAKRANFGRGLNWHFSVFLPPKVKMQD
eukprot:1470698-Amphidinium_carterae.1